MLKALYIGITPTIALLIVNMNINPYKLKYKDFIIAGLIMFLGCIGLYNINENLASIWVYTIFIPFIYIKSGNLIKSILLNAINIIIVVLVDSIISGVVFRYMKIDLYTPKFMLVTLIIFLGVYLVSRFIGTVLNTNNYFIKNYKIKYVMLIYIAIIATVIMFYVNINWNSSNNPIYLTRINSLIFIVYSIVLMFICCILFMSIKKEVDYKTKQIQFENLKEYNDKLEDLYMDMRKFRHDYINIISSMAGFIEDNDMKSLEAHFNKYIHPLNKEMNKNNYKLGLLKNIEIPAIKGVISTKVIRAQEIGLDTVIEIVEPINNISMDIVDISRCLGILLDNAIEAALESDKKSMDIAIIKKNTSIIIVIANSYNGHIPVISKLFKEGFSTKGENRGLGLSNLKEIINKYNNVSLDTYVKDQKFYQELLVSK